MKCLLIIDVQNGFVSERTKNVVPKIIGLMEEFQNEFVIATQFKNLDNSAFSKIMKWNGLKETPETNLIKGVKERADLIIEKNTYTACTDEVLKLLKDKNIADVYIAGIDTDCCVLKTAIDLFENNIRPLVLSDYCASNGGKESHYAAIKVLQRTIGYNQIITGVFQAN